MTSIFSRSKLLKKDSSTRSPSHASNAAEASSSTRSLYATSCARLVKFDDDELEAIAMDTKMHFDWRSIVLSARVGPARWRRQNADQRDDTAIYTRHEPQKFGVLAVGLVPGCTAEIVNVLQCQNSEQYVQQMAGVFEEQFKEGSFVHRVDVDHARNEGDDSLRDLSVKTVTFNKSGWMSNHEEWCYLDALYCEKDTGMIQKIMTTIEPQNIIAGLSGSRTKYFHGVTCGYLLRPGAKDQEEGTENPAEPPNITRVTFYGELHVPRSSLGFLHLPIGDRKASNSKMLASEKTIRQRLLKFGASTGRLSQLVRRQRLGLQVLADSRRFLPPTNTPCMVCTKMLLVAKVCRLCGYGVCSDCSDVHERATQPRNSKSIHVHDVRVCATCMERVDQARYSNLSASSLLGTHIASDPSDAKPPAKILKDLLSDALLTAPSPTRKASVMNVIKSLLDMESDAKPSSSGSFSSTTPTVLTPVSADSEYAKALDYLEVEPVDALSEQLRSDEERIYPLDMGDDSSAAVDIPIPADEEVRLRAVERVSITELADSTELEIICEVAAKEMGCASSTISIIDQDKFHVVASSLQELRKLVLPRDETMCSHTIMEHTPFIVKHPESDIRFSKFPSVDTYGVRYYCAFPLVGDDNQIVGSMCCVNSESVEVTESQFAAFKKLASTASKVVRMQTSKRLRKVSEASSSSDEGARVMPHGA